MTSLTSRGLLITYILSNIDALIKIEQVALLKNLHKDNVKIFEMSDGSRINLDNVSPEVLHKIADYIKKIIEKNTEAGYYLEVSD